MTLLGVDYTGGPETGGFQKILVDKHKSRKKPGFLVRSIKAKETGFLRVLGCGNKVFRKKPGF